MSLLMDALRKAEQQKQQGTKPPGSGPAESLSLEPLAESATRSVVDAPATAGASGDPHQRLPELPKRMEELDDQFFTTDPGVQKSLRALADAKSREAERATPAGAGAETASRALAQNVFAAKQPAPAIGYGFAITVSVATLIAVAAIGSYFYWQLQPKGGLGAGPALSARPAPPTGTPVANSIAPVQSAPVTPAAAPAPAVTPPAPAAMETRTTSPAPAPARTPHSAQAAPAIPPPQPDTAIRFSTHTSKADGTLEKAHEAFVHGDIDLARSIWVRTLQTDSRNVNALHGLAALAQQEGKPGQASALYRRILEVDPKDAAAHAALFALNVATDTRQTESQLKGMLAEQPGSPQLNFALGNLYAGEARWAEAQQAYFKAHVADATNPDYLYNLAVSLDHLHQASLAAQYYARALAAAKGQAAAFDPAQAEERMKMLQSGRAD